MSCQDQHAVVLPPRASTRGPAGLLLLVLWLAWSLGALWYLQRPALAAAHVPQRILAVLDLPHDDTGVLARIAMPAMPGCPCLRQSSTLEHHLGLQRLDVEHLAAMLPFPLIIVQGERLVYAGPAELDTGCGRGTSDIAPLIQRLLALPQPPMVVPVNCPCSTEPST